jgi:hypothetical protein
MESIIIIAVLVLFAGLAALASHYIKKFK